MQCNGRKSSLVASAKTRGQVSRCFSWCTAMMVLLATSSVYAARLPNPQLNACYPSGGQQGSTFDVSIEGADLEEVSALSFSHPGFTAVQKTTPPRSFESQPNPVPNQFTVSIAGDVPVGVYEVRAVGRHGVSTSLQFSVSDVPELLCDLKNTTLKTAMPVGLNSVVNVSQAGSDAAHYFAFEAQTGQSVTIRCQTRSIDSRMKGMLEVLNQDGTPIAFGRSTNLREAVATFTPSAGGPYVVKVYDATYAGGSANRYRLEISTRPWIDFVWPPCGQAGTTGRFTVYGYNLPEGVPAEEFDARFGLQKQAVDIAIPTVASPLCLLSASSVRAVSETAATGFDYRIPGGTLSSNPVFIGIVEHPVVLEKEPNQLSTTPFEIPVPCTVAGQFYPERDIDWFSFQGVNGEVYSIDLLSERLNLATDATMALFHVSRDANGNESTRMIRDADDTPTNLRNPPYDVATYDPSYTFQADADGEYRIHLRDQYAGTNSHPRNRYLLTVKRANPDFRLIVTTRELVESISDPDPQRRANPVLRRGGCQPLTIQVSRVDGYSGPITLNVEGLPQGVSCPDVVVPAGHNHASLVLTATLDAPVWSGPIQVFGTATIEGSEVRRIATPASIVLDKNGPGEKAIARAVGNLELGVIPETVPMTLAPRETTVWEVSRFGKLKIVADFTRHLPTTGNIRLEVRGLPTSIYPFEKVPAQVLEPQVNEGTVEVAIDPSLPAGDYPAYLTAQNKVAYSKNPEAVAAAQEKKQVLDARLAELTAESAKSQEAKAALEVKLAEMKGSEPANADPAVIEQIETELNQANASATQIAEVIAAVQAEIPNLDTQIATLTKQAEAKEIDLFVSSVPIVIRVLEMPFRFNLPAEATAAAGTDAEIQLNVERLFDFQDPITLVPESPAGVAGFTTAEASVAAGESTSKLILKTTADTPPGSYQLPVLVKVTYNGQELTTKRTVTFHVKSP
ncbi:hypothetical protein SH668x_001357 [Planctomicrobium sp. SH668]|uniref:hypothetical protein n=1 Tax=Planctomicrobium sp. SH668 TaxID=3448126 RepID=UPI003F5C0DD6